MILGLIIWPVLAVLGAAGLYAIAPRHTRGLYLLPVTRTVAVLATACAYVAWLFHL
ncbi:hypothetical protein AB0F46_21655 [Streptomyces sp. NPDC026665]|uniref:hypothetical protein n=1 Tax=Streptomyces sp. NPDC026665 TaxID=3154798 RepID=UPI0033F8C45B